MRHRRRFLIGALVVVALAGALVLIAAREQVSLAEEGIIYVDADATGARNGNSWKHAYTDLQPALDEAATGDQIWVAAGTYKPTAEHGGTGNRYRSFQMKNGVAVYGGFDPSVGDTAWEHRDWVAHVTILSGDLNGDDGPDFENTEENSYHVFYHPDSTALDPTAVLDGFTISGGNADGTVGPHWFGGGMYNERSSPTLTNCTFWSNSANHGGGIYNRDGSSPTLTNCTFTGNSASSSGGGIQNHTSSPILIDCIFSGNSTISAGGGMANAYSSPTLTNCTFSANSAVVYGGGMSNHMSSPELTNCILWGNTPDEILNTDQGSSPLVTYSDIQSGYTGDGNIDADPLFVDAGGGDYRLEPSSPCIDAGNNDAPNLPLTDFEGDARVLDGDGDGTAIVDMGADEMSEEPPPPPALIFVDADATGNDSGTSWEDAFNDLQTALEAAASGDQIWVAEGIYIPTEEYGGTGDRYRSFQMVNGVAIYGGFDPGEGVTEFADRDPVTHATILSGDLDGNDGPDFADNDENSYHVFYHPEGTGLDGTAILDGFTITGGNANLQYDHYQGGGMYNDGSSPALSNCTFSSNWAYNGGGLFNANGSSPALVDCAFSGNSAYWTGGGMRNDRGSSPTLTNCIFSGNWAGSDGGGMLNDYVTSPVLINCAFSGNSANYNGGAMVNWGASPVLTNCTFSGNSAYDGGGMFNFWYSSPMLLDCTFEANSAVSDGGGIYNTSSSSPTLTNSTFSANSAGSNGGAMVNWGASPVLTNCTFLGNSASDGGGMYNAGSSPALTDCSFADNSATSEGGGMYNRSSSPELTGCTFEGNSASNGGGMYNYSGSSPALTRCAFESNRALNGGGIYNTSSSSPTLTNCTFTGNSAMGTGGGMNNLESSPVLSNCTFQDNSASWGGGMRNGSSSPTLTNCTFSGNYGASGAGGMDNRGSSPELTNCILWGDTPDEIFNDDAGSAPVVTYSDIQGGYPGTGNIDALPFFVDPDNGDFHLRACSPSVDAGNNGAPDLPLYDFEGDDRVVDGDGNGTATVDMGVDEVVDGLPCLQIHLPLVLRTY